MIIFLIMILSVFGVFIIKTIN